MKDSLIVEASSQSPSTRSTGQILEVWIRLCSEFRERERGEILQQEPSPETLARYREELKWMIRATRALFNVVSDPDFPQSQFVSEISGKLLQLESSWKSLNNPLTEAEADAFIVKHFPDEAPTRSPAKSV